MDAGLQQTIMHDPGPARSMITYTFVGNCCNELKSARGCWMVSRPALRPFAFTPFNLGQMLDAARSPCTQFHLRATCRDVCDAFVRNADQCFLIISRRGCDVTLTIRDIARLAISCRRSTSSLLPNFTILADTISFARPHDGRVPATIPAATDAGCCCSRLCCL